MRFVTAMIGTRAAAGCRLQCARRAHREILLLGNALPSAGAANRAVVATRERDGVAEVERDEERLEQMTAVAARAPSHAGRD